MKLYFPEIDDAFVKAESLNEVCNNYMNMLYLMSEFTYYQYANKLREFINVDDKIHILEDEFRAYKEFLRNWCNKTGINVKIKIRKKDFISFNSKIRLYLCKNKDLNAIRDLLGIRIIICTDSYDNDETQILCYQLMNETLVFFAQRRKCLLLKAEERLGNQLDKDSEIAKKIFIHNKSELYPEFEDKVKNYVLQPKEDGYQGLHGYVLTPTGLVFEIQIRTVAMDFHDESLYEKYKMEKYANSKININFENIHLRGVRISEEGEVYDAIGLFESLDPLNIIKN